MTLAVMVVRPSMPWYRVTHETCRAQQQLFPGGERGQLAATLRELAQKWDDIFRMSFFEYRQRLAEISAWQNRKADFDLVIRTRDHRRYRALIDGLPPAFYFPTDDDDWYHPDIVERTLSALDATRPVLAKWGVLLLRSCWRKDSVQSRWYYRDPADDKCPRTNGYALSSELLRRASPERASSLIRAHGTVYPMSDAEQQDWVHETVRPDRTVLSVTYKSPASLCRHFDFSKNRTVISLSHEALAEELSAPVLEVPPTVGWASDAVDRVNQLNLRLYRSMRSSR